MTQQRGVALALQQRIGGDGRAHLHGADALGRDRRAGRDAEQLADALHRRVAIGAGVLRQQLVRDEPPSDRAATTSVKVPPRSIQKCQVPPVYDNHLVPDPWLSCIEDRLPAQGRA